MACSRPNLIGVDSRYRDSTFLGPRHQERSVNDMRNTEHYQVFDIPCGKCELCRVQRRYDRALRIMLEAESWPEQTTFITLTFDEKNLGSAELNHKEWSQFIKDFRANFCEAKFCKLKDRNTLREGKTYSKTFKQIKQVMCGEYGDTFGRKHFHGILFNHSFSDMLHTGHYSKKGNPIHTSPSLQRVWKKGFVQVETITFDLALYVGSYVTDALDDEDPNLGHKKKQYGLFGRGIGRSWIKKYWKDVLAAGKVQLIDRDYPVPRYFLKYIQEEHPAAYAAYKQKNLLRLTQLKEKTIPKGDGPLRRAKAKGEIFKHTQAKRKLDATKPSSKNLRL